MSKEGITATVLATTLSEAIEKDEVGEGLDMASGLFGQHTSQWLRDIADELSKLNSTENFD